MNVLAQLSSIPVRRIVALVAPVAILAGACADFPASPAPLTGRGASMAQASATPGTLSAGNKAIKYFRDGRLAFAGLNGIYTMLPDGSGLTLLNQGSDPSWSPDGHRIAFWRYGGAGGIYVMNADGSNMTRVAPDGYQPTWSPDGKQLAFGCGGICIINVDGTGRRSLTLPGLVAKEPDNCMRDSDPSWSRNGVIAFTRWPDVSIPTSGCLPLYVALDVPFDFWTQIWLVEADGTKLRSIKDAKGDPLTYAGWPAWSPDGSQLAFYTGGIGYDAIAVTDGYGFDVREVKRRSPVDWEEFLGGPDWSPDGKRIVFGSAANWGFATLSGEVTQPAMRLLPSKWATWSWSRR